MIVTKDEVTPNLKTFVPDLPSAAKVKFPLFITAQQIAFVLSAQVCSTQNKLIIQFIVKLFRVLELLVTFISLSYNNNNDKRILLFFIQLSDKASLFFSKSLCLYISSDCGCYWLQ